LLRWPPVPSLPLQEDAKPNPKGAASSKLTEGSEEVRPSRPSRRPPERLAWPLRRIELKSNYNENRTGTEKR
jgi:hypothetical protein